MNYKNYSRGGHPYETPTVNVFAILSEGVLCGSYDRPDVGYDNENDLGDI